MHQDNEWYSVTVYSSSSATAVLSGRKAVVDFIFKNHKGYDHDTCRRRNEYKKGKESLVRWMESTAWEFKVNEYVYLRTTDECGCCTVVNALAQIVCINPPQT